MISDSAARPPGPAEVVVRVAGVALGCEPAAEIAGVVEAFRAAARRALAEAEARRQAAEANATPAAKESGGPKGPEPTRYGDWENKGIASDF